MEHDGETYGDTDNYEDGHVDGDKSKQMHTGRVSPPGLHEQSFGLIPQARIFLQDSILRASQLVLYTGLDYNNLSARNHEKPPYAPFGSN